MICTILIGEKDLIALSLSHGQWPDDGTSPLTKDAISARQVTKLITVFSSSSGNKPYDTVTKFPIWLISQGTFSCSTEYKNTYKICNNAIC